MPGTNTSSKAIFLVAGVIALGLTFAGTALIVQSNNAYNRSLQYIETALKDTSLKDKLTFAPALTSVKEGYTESFAYFALAIGVLLLVILLPRLSTVSFGGFSIALKDLQQKVQDLEVANNDLQSKVAESGGTKPPTNQHASELRSQAKAELHKATGQRPHPDDPQKERWGGSSEANGRRLSAEVTPTALPEFFKVVLKVKGTSSNPLSGIVKFHLHDTFNNQDPTIAVINGEAQLVLNMVWGAFTVGAEADNGVTRLELDLSGNEVDAPQSFKER